MTERERESLDANLMVFMLPHGVSRREYLKNLLEKGADPNFVYLHNDSDTIHYSVGWVRLFSTKLTPYKGHAWRSYNSSADGVSKEDQEFQLFLLETLLEHGADPEVLTHYSRDNELKSKKPGYRLALEAAQFMLTDKYVPEEVWDRNLGKVPNPEVGSIRRKWRLYRRDKEIIEENAVFRREMLGVFSRYGVGAMPQDELRASEEEIQKAFDRDTQSDLDYFSGNAADLGGSMMRLSKRYYDSRCNGATAGESFRSDSVLNQIEDLWGIAQTSYNELTKASEQRVKTMNKETLEVSRLIQAYSIARDFWQEKVEAEAK